MRAFTISGHSRKVILATIVASCGALCDASAQELLWTRARATYDDWYGSAAAIMPDVDGDSLDDVVAGGLGVDCAGLNDGLIEVLSGAVGGKRGDWCGDEETAGLRVEWVHDVDGDGVAEVVVAGPAYWEPTQGRETGRITMLSGVTGVPIWALVGEQSVDHFGAALSRLGDIDGDGFDEILVSSQDYGTQDLGRVYVVSTKDAHVIRSHTGSNANERLGISLSRCDDMDGDGIVDYAMSTSVTYDFSRGRVDVFSGGSGALLWSKTGEKFDGLGAPVASAGDWDGDGRGDLIVRLYRGDGVLQIYSPAKDELLFEVTYQAPHNGNDSWAYILCPLGDLDADGVDEIAISAYLDGHDGRDTGRVDLCSGRTLRPLYRFYADGQPRGWFGWSMASGGDLNGDGIDDLVVGAPLPLKGAPKGGKVFAFALNDLYLQAEPAAPVVGDTVVVDLRGGTPTTLGLVALIDVSGTTQFEPLLLAPFDSNGELQLCADIDASVSGLDFTLMGYAQARTGRGPLLDATPFQVTVQ